MATPSGAPSSGTSWCKAPGEARSDLWQLMEFCQALHHRRGAGRPSCWRPTRSSRARPCSTCCTGTARSTSSPATESNAGYANDEAGAVRLLCRRRACSRSTPPSAAAMATTWRRSTTYHEARGLRWPVVNGKETRWRYREGADPYVKAGERLRVLRLQGRQGGHLRPALRAAGGIARQRLRPLAGHRPRAGALAFRDR